MAGLTSSGEDGDLQLYVIAGKKAEAEGKTRWLPGLPPDTIAFADIVAFERCA